MKKLFSLISILSFLFISWDIHAQWITIDSLKMVPEQPVKNEKVTIFLYTATIGTGKKVNFTYNTNNKNINMVGCYTVTGTATSTHHTDTISLGQLSEGIYYINFKSYWSTDPNLCQPIDSSFYKDSFIVKVPANIPLINSNNITIYPNPAKNVLNVITLLPIKKMRLYSIYGTEFNLPSIISNNLDISSLPIGYYLLDIYTNESRFIQHFFKE